MCCTDTCILSAHVRIAAGPHAGQREQDAGSTGQGYRGEKSMYQYGWEWLERGPEGTDQGSVGDFTWKLWGSYRKAWGIEAEGAKGIGRGGRQCWLEGENSRVKGMGRNCSHLHLTQGWPTLQRPGSPLSASLQCCQRDAGLNQLSRKSCASEGIPSRDLLPKQRRLEPFLETPGCSAWLTGVPAEGKGSAASPGLYLPSSQRCLI